MVRYFEYTLGNITPISSWVSSAQKLVDQEVPMYHMIINAQGDTVEDIKPRETKCFTCVTYYTNIKTLQDLQVSVIKYFSSPKLSADEISQMTNLKNALSLVLQKGTCDFSTCATLTGQLTEYETDLATLVDIMSKINTYDKNTALISLKIKDLTRDYTSLQQEEYLACESVNSGMADFRDRRKEIDALAKIIGKMDTAIGKEADKFLSDTKLDLNTLAPGKTGIDYITRLKDALEKVNTPIQTTVHQQLDTMHLDNIASYVRYDVPTIGGNIDYVEFNLSIAPKLPPGSGSGISGGYLLYQRKN